MKDTEFTITLGSDDHEILDDAVKRILVLDDGDKTSLNLTVLPVSKDGETGRRIQRRRIDITSTDEKILARAERIDFQKGVSVSAKSGK